MLTFSSLLYWCFLQICILSFFYQFSLFLFTFLPLDPLESIKSPGTKVVPLTKKLYGFTGNFVVMLFKLFSLFSYLLLKFPLLTISVIISSNTINILNFCTIFINHLWILSISLWHAMEGLESLQYLKPALSHLSTWNWYFASNGFLIYK